MESTRQTRQLGLKSPSLKYRQFLFLCLPGEVVSQEVHRIFDLKQDVRNPSLNLHVEMRWDSLKLDTQWPEDFDLQLDLQKNFWTNQVTILSLRFNCELMCKSSIPSLPDIISDRALVHFLSMQPISSKLGQL